MSVLFNENYPQTQLLAGETITSHKLVMLSSGKAMLYDGAEANAGNVIGFSITSAALDEAITVQMEGILRKTSWGLSPEKIYYATTAGNITDTPSGVLLKVGLAADADTLKIKVEQNEIFAGTTAPANPTVGQLWIDTN
jgi:hypothetical protein